MHSMSQKLKVHIQTLRDKVGAAWSKGREQAARLYGQAAEKGAQVAACTADKAGQMRDLAADKTAQALALAGDKGAQIYHLAAQKAAQGWSAAKVRGHQVRLAVARHPVSPLLYVTIVALAVGAVSFKGMYTRAYVLNVNGEDVALLSDEGELENIVSGVETRVARILGEEYDYEADISITPAFASAQELSDATAVEDNLFNSVGAIVEGYALCVDGEELGYAATEQELMALLDEIAAPYMDENTVRYDFAEDVDIYPVEIPSNTEMDLDKLRTKLTSSRVEEAYYTVEAGDTFNAVAYSLDMTPAELEALNPDVEPAKLWVGQQLTIQQAVPALSILTQSEVSYEQVVESPVEYIETADMYEGDTSVKERGADGLAQVTAQVSYLNGVEQSREVLSTDTIQEPTTTYIYKGTTPRPVTASKGYYIRPISGGTITSGFGYRYLFGSYSFHQGVDFASSYGTPIKAADGGTVTYAGWQGSYGKLVVITHDNGDKTYYAHCSSLDVSVGDKVYQGQVIARMGSTGNSTGNHVHFEIRVNGQPVNPMDYI